MHNYLFLLVLFFTHSVFGQDAAIELVEQSILYRGYDNLVKISPTKGGKVSLVGLNATITQKENGNYVVTPGYGKITELLLIRKSEQEADTIYRKRYLVAYSPDPTLYWGGNASGNNANRNELKLFAKFPSGVMLNATHRIEKWRMIYGDLEATGMGSDLSNAKEFLAEIPNKGVVTIECIVHMPEGHKKKIYGVWILND